MYRTRIAKYILNIDKILMTSYHLVIIYFKNVNDFVIIIS